MCWKIKTTVSFMWPASWSADTPSFYIFIHLHFDIFCFSLIMPAVNYVAYGCSSSRTTSTVITMQEFHTGGKPLLQLLLKIRWQMTIWIGKLKTEPSILVDRVICNFSNVMTLQFCIYFWPIANILKNSNSSICLQLVKSIWAFAHLLSSIYIA